MALTLYRRAGCPYCARVERAVRQLGVDLTSRDTGQDADAKQQLLDALGRGTVPVLRIEDDGPARWLPESRDIVLYLFARFGRGHRPGLRYGILTRRAKALLALGVLTALAWVAVPWLLGIHLVRADAPALPLSTDVFSHEGFRAPLSATSIDGVDYTALRQHHPALRRYVALLERAGPTTQPQLFPSHNDVLAYYINAYNALVLLGVLQHWPVASVQDVRGLIAPRAGFGFFWAQRFVLDGGSTHLHGLERRLRDRLADARLHGLLHCATRSCPPLGREPVTGATLQARLGAAGEHLTSDARHVRIDDSRREIVLSELYRGYAEDFRRHAHMLGAGKSVLDWIIWNARPEVAGALRRARDARYVVRYAPCDWRLATGDRAHER